MSAQTAARSPAEVVCVGMSGLDRIMTVAQLPRDGTKVYASGYHEVGGGPAATAAVAISRLAGRAVLVGRVGDDPTGQAIRAELAAYGVDVGQHRILPGALSASSNVMVDAQGERQLTHFPGQGLDVAPDWLRPDLLDRAGAVLVDMGWYRGARPLLEAARRAGIVTVLDADLTFDPRSRELLALADHVVFSQQALAGLSDRRDPVAGLHWAAERYRAVAIGVTVGSDGYRWLEAGSIRSVAGHRIDVVDTLGAGDVFHGAYALALAEGCSTADAARFANAAAALKCSRPSGRRGIPSRGEVERLLAGTAGHEPSQRGPAT